MKGVRTVEVLGKHVKIMLTAGVEEELSKYGKKHNLKREDVPQRIILAMMEFFANATEDDLSIPDISERIEKMSWKFRALPAHEIFKIEELMDEVEEASGGKKKQKK